MTIISQQCFKVLLIAVFSFVFPAIVFAENYSVVPLLIDHELEKRDIVEEKITITNREGRLLELYPTVNEVSVNEGGTVKGFVEPSMTDRTTSVTSWLEITRAKLELQPGETKEVTLTIRVNPEVVAGEYHAFIGFAEGTNRPEAEKKVYEGQAPGTVVRISIDKVQNQFLRLEKFTVERFVKSSSEGEIVFALQNPGLDVVIPQGEIIFYDNNGTEVQSIPINTELIQVEPNKSVTFVDEVPDELTVGKYKAFLSVEYGEHQIASLHDTVFFYVLPVKQLLIIFSFILVFSIILALYIHRRYGKDYEYGDAEDVALFIRESRSESKDHDIDLSKKNNS